MFVDEEFVRRMKEKYPVGSRIVLDYMGDDPHPIEPSTKGTVRMVDDMGTVHCDFDNGRPLGLGDEDFDSLPKDLCEKYSKMFEYPEMFFRVGNEIEAVKLDVEENIRKPKHR